MFSIYKRGQGKYTRLCSAFGAVIIVALGCMRLYGKLGAAVDGWGLSRRDGIWVSVMIPVGLFVTLGFLIFWLVNKISIADFMISAEGEMKKVSWSSRKEIMVSTFVVIMVVFIMAVLLGVTDLVFRLVFSSILS